MSDYPMLISNKLHSFRNFKRQIYEKKTKWRLVILLDIMAQNVNVYEIVRSLVI